ncbi:hypothetical protein A359_08340 [secondary endosymbiont of Ctenarytaina eucalypti]|uniref:Uncharacterized protein n=1 Tax=secondary endosymbiont of Ctenarytaina eucalypti TaxID=1199245 RepID=J3TY10_9ENTR|nr:hypothetical protein A359_08340 [secondary endosymbiont of Ctenarytaina eucalypti]
MTLNIIDHRHENLSSQNRTNRFLDYADIIRHIEKYHLAQRLNRCDLHHDRIGTQRLK